MKFSTVIIICLSVFTVIIVGVMMGRDSEKVGSLEIVLLGDMVQRIDQFHLIRLRGEDIEWEIGAKRAIIYNGEDDTEIQEIDITYNPPGGTPIKLIAERGRYNIGTNTFYVKKLNRDVDIKVGKNLIINTGSLVWSEEKRERSSPGQVHVRGEKFILEGENLIANLDTGVYEIKKNIQATVW